MPERNTGIPPVTRMSETITSGSVKRMNESTPDDPAKIATGGIKYDAGKPSVWQGLINYFPRACSEVAAVSTFGAKKYAWKGWEKVENGFNRYSDAMARHFMAEGREELLDPDSELVHAAHTAWNAMARLELLLREMEKKNV